MGEPFGSLSILGQYKVMQGARQRGLKVMLDGQGADELFLGYRHGAIRVIGEHFKRGRLAAAAHEWRALSRNAAMPLAVSALGNIYLGSSRLVQWHRSRPVKQVIQSDWLAALRGEMASQLFKHKALHDHQVDELTRHPLPGLLRYEDRNSMAFGLEARVPMLSSGLLEAVLPLPCQWKVRNGWTKYALRMAMRGCLPDEVLWQRRKRRFEVPQKRWIEAARPQIDASLADLPQDCPVDIKQLKSCLDAGHAASDWLWRCLSVALWIRFSGVRV
jgi:asparagine synthase (glutamine-hydrolysing)